MRAKANDLASAKALLRKNRDVDIARLDEVRETIQEISGFIKRTERPLVSPYGGKRLLSDRTGRERAQRPGRYPLPLLSSQKF